jgi:hypothetical protein
MISSFILNSAAIVLSGTLSLFPAAETRAPQHACPDAGSVISRAYVKEYPPSAVVKPNLEFDLIDGPEPDDKIKGNEPRPAWLLLYLLTLTALYLYHCEAERVLFTSFIMPLR